MSSPTSPTSPTSSTSSSASSLDSIGAAFDDLVESVDHALTNAAKLLGGTYSGDDAAADVKYFSAKVSGWVQEIVGCWSRLGRGPNPEFPVSDPTITTHLAGPVRSPVTLQPQSFRAVGWGPAYAIGADAVTLQSATLAPPQSAFTITVVSDGLPLRACARTIIYEGTVVNSTTGRAICDPIRFVRPADLR